MGGVHSSVLAVLHHADYPTVHLCCHNLKGCFLISNFGTATTYLKSNLHSFDGGVMSFLVHPKTQTGKKTHTCLTSGVRSSPLVFRIQPQTPDLQQQLFPPQLHLCDEDTNVHWRVWSAFLLSVFSRCWRHAELKGTSVEHIISKSHLAFLITSTINVKLCMYAKQ